MLNLVPVFIGLRYTRAKRRTQFISFVSGFSLLGMAFGVFALTVVLSVMNGFDRELKKRILSAVPHGFITSQQSTGLADWQALVNRIEQEPQLVASAPYVEGFGLMGAGRFTQGVTLQGILPELESRVSDIQQHMVSGSMLELNPGEFGIVIGRLLARYFNVDVGDRVTLTLPYLSITPAGVFPRSKRFRVVGVFEVGAQVDQGLALIHMQDMQKLLRRSENPQGLHVKVTDIYQAGAILAKLQAQLEAERAAGQSNLEPVDVKDWSQTQGSLFQAVKMEKIVIGVLLMIIVAVAAFNIVSSLVLMVADKRADIAVLRTLGLTGRQVMAVFIVQGSAVGFMGILVGAVVGALVAHSIGDIVQWLENLLGLHVFDPSVYFISYLPSLWLWSDTLIICACAALLSVIATLYPAYRAAKIAPAEALRYE